VTTTLGRAGRHRAPAAPLPLRPRLARAGANLVGAAGAALFARAGLQHFLATRSLIGAGFVAAQLWVVVAYLVRRPATAVTTRPGDWLLAFGGTFGGVLLRPSGLHDALGVSLGTVLQSAGLLLAAAAFVALGRSFGFAAADRGLAASGPYRVVRHPLYVAYALLQLGYLAQSLSPANIAVVALVLSCDVGRALVEERLLSASAPYRAYRAQVHWRLVPGLW
jgi:protein-S-isoprenylcysteine O-methyltransferase Ste14